MSERQRRADERTKEALEAFYRREPLVVVQSPPGGGKSGIIVRSAALGFESDERVLVGAQTQDQAIDLARTFYRNFPKIPFAFIASARRIAEAKDELKDIPTATVEQRASDVDDLKIVIANTSKWGFVKDEIHFDALVIDEAYQMPSALLDRIAGLGKRYLLVGDPGQIQPIVQSDVRGFRTHPDAPHRPAPLVALHRAKQLDPPCGRVIKLPISRRLVDDTAAIVQRVFYPTLPFEGLATVSERSLIPNRNVASQVGSAFLERVAGGQTLLGVRLSGSANTAVDEDIVRVIEELVQSSIGQAISYNGTTKTVEAEDIGVVCARTAQVSALQAILPNGVYVETANRMQGLEKPIVFAWHPVSGVLDPSDFHLEIGRLCVALSRHLVACALVYREAVEQRLHEQIELGARSLAHHDGDVPFESLISHHRLLEELRGREITI